MQEDTGRTAFTFAPVLRHRTNDAARRITALSLDTAAGRIFLGLASGIIEEHQIVSKQPHFDASCGNFGPSANGPWASGAPASTRLVAEKRVSRKPVTALACLPTAARLAIVCEDGSAAVASYDTWVVTALQGVRTATAMAADPAPAAATAAAVRRQQDSYSSSSGSSGVAGGNKPAGAGATVTPPSPKPVRLAVAVKSISTAAKLLVYSVAPSVGGFATTQPAVQLLAQVPLPEPVTGLTWVGSGLFVQHPLSYNLLLPGGRVTQIAEHGCTQPRMLSAPWLGGPAESNSNSTTTETSSAGAAAMAAASARSALLFQDSLLILTDGTGAAVVGSEPITVSEPPLALCSSGPFLVLLSDADQGILVYDRASSKLVQRIFWAHDDPWVAAARSIPVAEDAAGGGGVAVATSNVVMMLQPVAADMQARELLKRKRFDAALALIRTCRRAGEEWADVALAQAGLLLLQELRCEDALAALEEAGPATFQPAQLLPLFPATARRWAPERLPAGRSYWGLHGGGLQSLERLCEDFLELRNSTASSPRPSPPGSIRGGAPPSPPPTANASAATAALLAAASNDNIRHHHHHHSRHNLHHHHPHTPAPDQQQQQLAADGGGGGMGGEVGVLVTDAKRHIVSYLLRTRGSPGVTSLDAVDCLIAQLLLDTGQTAALEAFLASAAGAGAGGAGAGSGTGPGTGVAAAAAGGGVPPTATAAPVTGPLGAVSRLLSPPPQQPAATAAAAAAAAPGAGNTTSSAPGTPPPPPPAQCSPRDPALVASLEAAGRWHALAVLRAARGQGAQALELWERLAVGEVKEALSTGGAVADAAAALLAETEAAAAAAAAVPGRPPHLNAAAAVGEPPATTSPASLEASSSIFQHDSAPQASTMLPMPPSSQHQQQQQQQQTGEGEDTANEYDRLWAAATAAVAATSAAALMCAPDRTPPLLCLSKLPWLLHATSDWALHVMRSRPLPVADVLSLLQGRSDGVRWQYLHHLVYCGSGSSTGSTGKNSTGHSSNSNSNNNNNIATTAAAAADLRSGGATPERGGDEPHGGAAASHSPSSFSASPALHRDPALHTELALELVECLGALMQQPQGGGRAQGGFSHHEEGGGQQQQQQQQQGPEQQQQELPPALPPLVALLTRYPSETPTAAGALPAAASPPQHPPHRIGLSPHRMLTSGGTVVLPQTTYDNNVRQQRLNSQQPPQQQPSSLLLPPSQGSHGVTAAAATAATAVDGGGGGVPATSELAWLATIGSIPAAAVARLLRLALRGALAAAGQDPSVANVAAAANVAGGGGAVDDGGSTAAGSLPLLRALSRGGDGAGIGTAAGLRAVLQHHLYFSQLYDATIVLQAVQSCSPDCSHLLAREVVQLYCRLSDHAAALAVLALQLGDVEGAICYCRARCGQEGWLALLDLLLRPPDGRDPDYSAACRVLAAEGAALAPLQLLEALSDSMPLYLAHSTLSRMMGALLHRRRQGQVLRALHRAQNLALRAELAQLQSSRVVVSDETLCRGCQRPLGSKVFYRYPSGVVLCGRCTRPEGDSTPAPE